MNIIVAINKNNGIGFNNSIPWKNKNDMQFFRMMTYGKTVYMGRKTYESLGKPLEGRINCVLSTKDLNRKGITLYKDKDKFLTRIMNDEEGFVIGGAEIYNLALDAGVIKNVYVSIIDNHNECDAFFYLPFNFDVITHISFGDLTIQRWMKK
jgi:dihydrofolate reductase